MLQCCQYKMNTDIKQMLYVGTVSAKENINGAEWYLTINVSKVK